MVKVREQAPRLDNGHIDLDTWLDSIQPGLYTHKDLIRKASELADEQGAQPSCCAGQSCFELGLEIAEVLIDLQVDPEALSAALVLPSVVYSDLPIDTVRDVLGDKVARLVEGVQKMSVTHALFDEKGTRKQSAQEQAGQLRKMLLAIVEDVRVVLIKLAECVCMLRRAKHFPEKERRQYAQEVMDIYAPLANRLGIGQIKWELEDFAFRYLNPEDYKNIATLLDERRLDRDQYIKKVIDTLKAKLESFNIKADIHGRAKHIFSIWRKMKRKNVPYGEIYDVRAVRILVPEVKDCYGALGVVHSLWQHIPNEFDDYIATPKDNGYQSLHTAVIGPDRKNLEVQIRTFDMHQDSELGVAAHWRYKEGEKPKQQAKLDEKIEWLRQVLDWQNEMADTSEFVDELRAQAFDDRVYVFTPKGDVVELPSGATVLDFAYHIHTDVGHRCRGAKVNGRIVQLNTQLSTSDTIEILTSRNATPSRDWLIPQLGYLKSPRSRAKVHGWFNQQDYSKNLEEGQASFERELGRIGLKNIDLDTVAKQLNFKKCEDLFAALGKGDVRLRQAVKLAEQQAAPIQKVDEIAIFKPSRAKSTRKKTGIQVEGEDNVMTHIAGCCKPVPGDPVVGYITSGRGITIHRHDCTNVDTAKQSSEERLIQVQWEVEPETAYSLDVLILAYDRQGLLRDITRQLSMDNINVIGLNTRTNKADNIAELKLTIEVSSLEQLASVLSKVAQIPNIFEVKRL